MLHHQRFQGVGNSCERRFGSAHRLLPRRPAPGTGRLNWPAAALLSGWLVALLLGLSEVGSHGWGSVPVPTKSDGCI